MKTVLASILIIANIIVLLTPTTMTVFPYIPPLTHTPGMGVSLLGEPQMPPFLFLDSIQRVGQIQCQECPALERSMNQQLERGKEYRLEMQNAVIELIPLLPENTVYNALLNRDENEQRIGEVAVWKKLQQ